ncbi:MAG: ATP-binding protein, partial [Candidatus Omnitrophica bacterium]|nr:ATP-binding protein [Candidatus Omnitrophota bacterium]
MIKEIIYEYWKGNLPVVKPRDLDFKFIETDHINDIVGIRRAGKTYILFFIIQNLLHKNMDKKATIYINFENRKLHPLKGDYFNQIIEVIYAEKLLEKFKRIYLFFDEVQNVPQWQKYLRSIFDEFKSKIKIFISGSNAKLLGKEYANLLTGRHLSINVFPLSFREFLVFNNFVVESLDSLVEKEKSLIKKLLEDFIRFGGFPEVVLNSSKEEILSQYFSDIISRDVLFKQNLRKGLYSIEELGFYLLDNIANLTSFRRLTNLFLSRGTKISLPTREHYSCL